ncbi:MAG: transposase, partial [Chloroflexi bacterium]|nr:transposase [Chloroflexota bacterium]
MPRRSDEFRAGCYYHLYNRGVNKERIFFDNENFAFFLRQMRHYFNDAVDVVAYCLMPNHYHLLAYLHTDDLVSVMQPFVMSFAKAINKRYERVGPLFQGRFASKLIDCDDYLLHLSRYIHLNPVVSGLAGKAEEWEYSSYPEYIGLRGGTLPSLSIAQPEGKSAARSENCHFLQLMIGSKTPLKAQFALFARS